MTKTRVLLVVCLAWMLALVGCGGGNPMVGTWTLKLNDAIKNAPGGGDAPIATAEFKADNTFEVKTKMGGSEQTVSGTYELKDKELTMKTTKEDGKPSSDKPEVVTLSDDMKSFPVPGAAGMGSMVKS